MNKKLKQTNCIDGCECVYCGCSFKGREACNGDMDIKVVICPECNKPMWVSLSIEYMCTEMTKEEIAESE